MGKAYHAAGFPLAATRAVTPRSLFAPEIRRGEVPRAADDF